MKFHPSQNTYNARYFLGLIGLFSITGYMLLYPPLVGEGFIFFDLMRKIFTAWKVIVVFGGVIIYGQLMGYLSTQTNIKLLYVSETYLSFLFFNNKTITLPYSDISSFNYTNDIFKNFEFVMKNGEKKLINASIKDKRLAFDTIRQKISEANTLT